MRAPEGLAKTGGETGARIMRKLPARRSSPCFGAVCAVFDSLRTTHIRGITRPLSDLKARITELLGSTPEEWPALVYSFFFFLLLLCGYYVIRPLRDVVLSSLGVADAPKVFTLAFVLMLLLLPAYGAIVAKMPRRLFLMLCFAAINLILLGFYAFWDDGARGHTEAFAFTVFVTVFNLFIVSVFWSFMADIYTTEQAKRLFGVIAAGGTIGALLGPLLTSQLVAHIGQANLLLVTVGLFALCMVCLGKLLPWARAQEKLRNRDGEAVIGGGVWAGAKLVFKSKFLFSLVVMTFIGVTIGTLIYYQRIPLALAAFPDETKRAAFFAYIDLLTNGFTLLMQFFLVRFILTRFGVMAMFLIPAIVIALGFVTLLFLPGIMALALVQAATRAMNFALVQPAKESLFTRIDRESRYKAKNFIDTAVYRAGDVSLGWASRFLIEAGISLGQFAILGIALAAAFGLTGVWVNRLQQKL